MTVTEYLKTVPKGSVWKHYKGNRYEVITVALHSETLEPMVVYRSLSEPDSVWARPLSMWLETVTVDGKTQPRFAEECENKSAR